MLNERKIPIASFVGYSGSGKTTLMAKVIHAFKQQGYRVAAIKHDAHRFEMDHEGKDTWKFAQAGSDVVLINSQEKLAMIEKVESSLSFEAVISYVKDVDIILVEGYKHEAPSKILVVRREEDLTLLSSLKDVIAIATSLPLDEKQIPIYDLDDVEGIVELIQSNILGEIKDGSRS
ncbi:molybdopterin-guanine dinucleotide biosynthesis protein B [Tepidibacillus decaturensis]|nr:molybdopterin-guanine dinucleotide biosynthesis protein B [Tepidibacillus decaturensis]